MAWLVRNHLILSITSQKKDISDPDSHSRLRPPRRRSGAPRLSVCAHRRGRARHQPEALERLEGAAVRGILRAHQARPAPRPRDAGRPGRADPRDPGGRPRQDPERISRRRHRAGLVADGPRRIFCATRPEEIAWHTAPARRPRPGSDDAPGRGPAARRAGGTAVLTYTRARRAQLRAHHRGARPDGTQRRRCPPHHERQRLQPGDLRGARGQRRRDRRLAPASAKSSAACGALCSSAGGYAASPSTRRAPRQVRMFSTPTQVNFSVDNRNHRSVLELIAGGSSRPAIRGRQSVHGGARRASTAPRS